MKKWLQDLFFPKEKFSTIEESISFKIILITIFTAIIGIPVCIVTGFSELIVAAVVVIVFYTFLLYLLRYREKFNLIRSVFLVANFAFLVLLWFKDAGIQGVVGIFFISLSVILPIVLSKKYQIFAISIIVFTIIVLSLIDYFFNHLITKYKSPEDLYFENTIAYVIQAIFLFLIIRFFKETYDKNLEKLRAKESEIIQSNQLLEEKNQRLQEMIENNRRLFSIISHDIRSPIASSKAFIEAIYQGDIEVEKLQDLIPDMHRNFQFTLSLVDNLLFWAKSQFEEFKPNIKILNLNEFFSELAEGFSLLAAYKRIKLELDIPPKPIFINFDREILEIVIRNVFSNAVKFSHFEGVVSISCFRKNGFLYIFVIDNGVGITPEDLEKIKRGILFSHKGTGCEKGTGLGLSLCQNLLQKCDASLDIESDFGKGTGVSIKIPAKYIVEAKQTVASTQDLSAD